MGCSTSPHGCDGQVSTYFCPYRALSVKCNTMLFQLSSYSCHYHSRSENANETFLHCSFVAPSFTFLFAISDSFCSVAGKNVKKTAWCALMLSICHAFKNLRKNIVSKLGLTAPLKLILSKQHALTVLGQLKHFATMWCNSR